MNRYAIIVAGGIGARMGADQPKQFLPLGNKPILIHTIEKFLSLDSIHIIITLPHDHMETWLSLKNTFFKSHTNIEAVVGGETRFHSVKNGLHHIKDTQALVAIHDAVRPLVSTEIIEESFSVAEETLSAVASVALKDSIRQIGTTGNEAKNRSDYRLIQTPQTFVVAPLKKAFEHDYRSFFTDDASVFEHDGHTITLIEGSYENIKITTPEDLLFAEAILKRKENTQK